MDATVFPLLSRSRSLQDLLAFDRFIVIGANSGGDQVRQWLAAHGRKVLAFADLAPQLQGTQRAGLGVLAPMACLPLADAATAFVIGTFRQQEAAEHLIDHLGVDPGRVFPFVNPMFAVHYGAGIQEGLAPQLDRVRGFLCDQPSRAYFDRVTAFYRTLDSRHLTPQPKRIGQYGYDAPGANPRAGANIVDCGAFVGDTVPDFLAATGADCHVHALEAFPPNFQRLTAEIAKCGWEDVVTPMAVAAGARAGTIRIAGDDTLADGCAHVGAGTRDHLVACDTLDNLFLDRTPIDYLKMDIEGAELDALAGGRRLLARDRPVAAIAAYHRPEHLVQVAEFLCETLAPCRLYAAHDPSWVFHIHYVAVPEERAIARIAAALC